MLLFRSEEHLDKWLTERNMKPGGIMSVEQQWELADKWYSGRLDPEWRRPSPKDAQKVFKSVGLTGAFWKLT